MQVIIKGRQMEVTPRLRQLIEQKVNRLSRLVNDGTRVEVTVTEEQTRSSRDRYSVQLVLSNSPHPIRSEVSAVNASIALDKVLGKVIAQLGRHKGRKTNARRHQTSPVKVLTLSRSGDIATIETAGEEEQDVEDIELPDEALAPLAEERNEEIWSRIIEIRQVPTKPMSDQEVIVQMEELGAAFYPFFNAETNSVNVMYRLESGGYGLLVPALE